MSKVYYSIATFTAFLSFSLFFDATKLLNDETNIQYIDMSHYPMLITVKKEVK
jgi:hypothetical protein